MEPPPKRVPLMSRLRLGLAGTTFLLGCVAGTATGANLLPTRFPTDAAARAAWVAGKGAPEARAEHHGVRLYSPFQNGNDRFYWDCPVRLNLRDASSLRLTLTAHDPTSTRTLSLYFKSGDGWYHWSRPIRGTGRQTVTLVKSDMSIEGTPAGWDRIESVRVSPWAATARASAFVIHELTTRRDTILLVQGTVSLPNEAERTLSRRTAGRVSEWLNDQGVAHGVLDDEGVIAGSLASAKVAILCYNSNPPQAELDALRRFVNRGGTLLVFYSASAPLATMMGFRLGRFESPEDPGRWSAMRFTDTGGLGLPPRVFDQAWSRIPVTPAHRDARVIAVWEDAAGRVTQDAVCLAGPHGYWFTHLPRSEDDAGKRRMLLALVGSHEPNAWRDAARHRLASAGRIGPYEDLPTALKAIPARASGSRRNAAKTTLEPIPGLHRAAAASFAAGRHRESIRQSDALRKTLETAYGQVHVPQPAERRAVWDHDALGWYPGDWNRSCATLAEAGLTAVFPNLMWAGKAHYPSRHVPGSGSLKRYGDQARQCTEAARRHGLEVHAWVVCWNLENAPRVFTDRMRREKRLQQSASGQEKVWLCPHHPDNRTYMADAIRELAAAYPVQGIHLDYIRLPGADHCFCPLSRKAFEAHMGHAVPSWPHAVRGEGALATAWMRWRAERMTAFVQRIRSSLNAIRPGIQLSAAVYRQYPSCRDSIGQDWGQWVRQGLVDFVCPMNYTEDLANFRAEVGGYQNLPGARGRILPGIGVTAGESRLSPDQVLDQITAARTAGTPGFILFDLNHTLRRDTLPVLRLGATAP